MKALRMFVLAGIGLAIGATRPDNGTRLEGKVVKVSDGDTLTLKAGHEQYVIRLAGIDAPESGQDFGKVARQALSRKVLNREVRVLVTDNDRYGRVVGIVYETNRDCVNTELVEEGCAWHYVEYSKSKILGEAEQKARVAKVGLWAHESQIAPWEWRQQKRQAVDEPQPAEGNEPMAAAHWLNTATGVRHNGSCKYHKNTSKGRSCGSQEGKPCSICGG